MFEKNRLQPTMSFVPTKRARSCTITMSTICYTGRCGRSKVVATCSGRDGKKPSQPQRTVPRRRPRRSAERSETTQPPAASPVGATRWRRFVRCARCNRSTSHNIADVRKRLNGSPTSATRKRAPRTCDTLVPGRFVRSASARTCFEIPVRGAHNLFRVLETRLEREFVRAELSKCRWFVVVAVHKRGCSDKYANWAFGWALRAISRQLKGNT